VTLPSFPSIIKSFMVVVVAGIGVDPEGREGAAIG
jgi:hypothetical protein